VVSPVVITRACAQLLNWDVSVVNCGVFHAPLAPYIAAGEAVAKSVATGKALSLENTFALYEQGLAMGSQYCDHYDYLVVGECVPGGTTTALALVTMLGFDAQDLVSSSWPKADKNLRSELVEKGIESSGLDLQDVRDNPLAAVAAIGDPMQPFVAGLVQRAAKNMPVILGGGSQMMAVYALIQALEKQKTLLRAPVITTKWVVYDKQVETTRFAQLMNVPLACARVDFSQSRYPGLRAYESGHVKEGVAAGAALAIALSSGNYNHDQILKAIENTCAHTMGEVV
jgi:uncharacterized protein (TIGR00303 family)